MIPATSMLPSVEFERLRTAYEKARTDLLNERNPSGHWVGELSTSALSTATAVSALSEFQRQSTAKAGTDVAELIECGAAWLLSHPNDDGGWGDTDRSYSNVATTMLAVAALKLADLPQSEQLSAVVSAADRYLDENGRIDGLRKRYGKDKTFAVPILANSAIAGMVPWSEVAPLPFELACFPQKVYRFLQMPVVSYAIPALVAVGQARFFHAPPRNPLTRLLRRQAVERSLRVLLQMQPASGGYLEAVPLTSFVVMSLAAIGRADHAVTENGVRFLIDSVRADGSWPIDTNLATWNTTLSINGLAAAGENVSDLNCWDWLLACQQKEVHPFTGAEPGGWGWTDLSGSVPDADDTPSAMIALRHLANALETSDQTTSFSPEQLESSLDAGTDWLLDLQNRDGGWPTFCRGWGKLPFDRSGADLTAHVLRAIRPEGTATKSQVETAIDRGFRYLQRVQQADGSWMPLWFGNQDRNDEDNPVYGTAKVLLVYRDYDRLSETPARNGIRWLIENQNEDGGWGGGASAQLRTGLESTVEETALAVESLLASYQENSASTNKSLQVVVS